MSRNDVKRAKTGANSRLLHESVVGVLVPLTSLDKHEYHVKILEMFNKAMPFFPELDVVYLGITDDHHCKACADNRNNLIKYNLNDEPKFTTIFHELGHLVTPLIGGPKNSEPFASLIAFSRIPTELIDEDHIPYLGTPKFPKSEWPKLCLKALEFRKTNRNYIQKFMEIANIRGFPYED